MALVRASLPLCRAAHPIVQPIVGLIPSHNAANTTIHTAVHMLLLRECSVSMEQLRSQLLGGTYFMNSDMWLINTDNAVFLPGLLWYASLEVNEVRFSGLTQ